MSGRCETETVTERLRDGTYVFSRESLADERVVRWLWENADEYGVSRTPHEITMWIRGFPTEGNLFETEVATALDYHTDYNSPDRRYSRGFANEIARQGTV